MVRTTTEFVNTPGAFYKLIDDTEKTIKNIFIGRTYVGINYENNADTATPHKFHNPVVGMLSTMFFLVYFYLLQMLLNAVITHRNQCNVIWSLRFF